VPFLRTWPVDVYTKVGTEVLPMADLSTIRVVRVGTTSLDPIVYPSMAHVSLTTPKIHVKGAHFGTNVADISIR